MSKTRTFLSGSNLLNVSVHYIALLQSVQWIHDIINGMIRSVINTLRQLFQTYIVVAGLHYGILHFADLSNSEVYMFTLLSLCCHLVIIWLPCGHLITSSPHSPSHLTSLADCGAKTGWPGTHADPLLHPEAVSQDCVQWNAGSVTQRRHW